jgi:hypothetical protein
MAHLSDGTYNAQGWGAPAASPKTPKSHSVTACSRQKDHKEAREAPDNLKDEADEDSASNDRKDDNRTKAIASRDLAALNTLAENRSI